MLGTITKQPADQLDDDVDYSEWLTPDDRINSIEVHIYQKSPSEQSDNPLSLSNYSISDSGLFAKIWLKDGRDGEQYKVTVIAATLYGRVKEVDFVMRIKDC